jgi:hypothetical protein
MKRKWLKALMLGMLACASFGAPMNPKEIEDLMYIMNETRIEFTIPDEEHKGEGGKPDCSAEITDQSSPSLRL